MAIRSKKILRLLEKSRESAILAVDVYNKPSTNFRSYGYMVLMIIAWTALIHAIFEKKRVKYYYKDIVIDGENKSWDISKCIKHLYKQDSSPVRRNLEFIVGLRNKIEHRFLPALDPHVIGECQALLMNFERLFVENFGEEYTLNDSLAIPLQLLNVNPDWKNKVLKELQSSEYELVKNYIDVYRDALDENVFTNSQYSFRVFLTPKTGNRKNSSDLAIEFKIYDPENPDDFGDKKDVVMVKENTVKIPVANLGMFKSGEVSKRVGAAINKKFHAPTHHSKCWRYYGIRPETHSKTVEKTDMKYCHWDEPHRDYVYTDEWIKFLITELSDPEKRLKIFGKELISLNPE